MPYKFNSLLAKLIQEVPPKSNFSATSDPGVNDDDSEGYEVGSEWANITTDKAYICLDATTGAAVWTETTAGAAGGESNTASNVGTAGVGAFKQKNGVDLEFKKINAGSSKITITDDIANDEVDIDVVTGATANNVCIGNDARLSDTRTPVAHAGNHVTGGSDVITNAAPAGNAGLMTGADKTKMDGIEDLADVTDAVNIASSVVGVAAKATPIDADTVPLIDSADGSSLKEVLWSQIKATLKTYFDTLYNLYVHPNHTGDVTSVADGATTIAAGAVDVPMMANGTDGELITWDAAGAPDTVGVGTATHVLTSNGIGVAPTFQASTSIAKEKLWFSAESAYLPVTNPAALTEESGSTVYAGQSHLDFDDTTAEHAVWRGPIIDYDGGNIVINASAKVASTPAAAKTLIFHIYAIGIANSEAYDAADTVDTGVDITFDVDATELLTDMIKATATIDPANVANGDKIVIELIRNVASDTLVGDGEIIDFTAEYTRS